MVESRSSVLNLAKLRNVLNPFSDMNPFNEPRPLKDPGLSKDRSKDLLRLPNAKCVLLLPLPPSVMKSRDLKLKDKNRKDKTSMSRLHDRKNRRA